MYTSTRKSERGPGRRAGPTPAPSRVLLRPSDGVGSLLHLQRTVGNRATRLLLQAERSSAPARDEAGIGSAPDEQRPAHTGVGASLQMALRVGGTGDVHEREAERVAERVMRMPEPQVRRACACGGTCPDCEQEDHQGHELVRATPVRANPAREGVAPPVVHEALRMPGQPLDTETRAFMEPRFGHDFSRVRVHTDAVAADSARAIGARAYTVGPDIAFGAGEYAPRGRAGKRLLAHELAHVVQQGATADRTPAARAGRSRQTVRRYHHEDCAEDDLRSRIWPADGMASQMVDKAVSVMGDPAKLADPTVQELLKKYFKTTTPNLTKIKKEYSMIQAAFKDNDYTYECEEECEGEGGGKVAGYTSCLLWDIHLCMNLLRTLDNHCIARTIVHEFAHRYACLYDHAYCEASCSAASHPFHLYGCPSNLTPDDAVTNASSYADFAWACWMLGV